MRILRDQWGAIPAIAGNGWAIVWAWPRGGMWWFFWNRGSSYRIGPLTLQVGFPRNA